MLPVYERTPFLLCVTWPPKHNTRCSLFSVFVTIATVNRYRLLLYNKPIYQHVTLHVNGRCLCQGACRGIENICYRECLDYLIEKAAFKINRFCQIREEIISL